MKLFLSSYENNIFAPFWHLALLCPILFKTKKNYWDLKKCLYSALRIFCITSVSSGKAGPPVCFLPARWLSTILNSDEWGPEERGANIGDLEEEPTHWLTTIPCFEEMRTDSQKGLQGSAEDHDSGEPIPQVQRRSPSSTRRIEHWPTSEKLREETDRAGEGRIWADHNCTAFTLHCIADRTLDRREEDIGGSLHSPQLRHAPSTLHPSSSSGQLRVLSCLEYQV